MTTKEYLKQAYRIDQRINSKLAQVASLRELARKATTTLKIVPSGAYDNHSMESVIVKIVDLENEINRETDALIETKRGITEAIRGVKNIEYQTLLELRYLCFYPWEEIAASLHKDVRWVYRIHDRALKYVLF